MSKSRRNARGVHACWIVVFLSVLVLPSWGQQTYYTPTTPMILGRQMYGAAVLGDFLYLIGGNKQNEGYTRSVQMARIGANGHLGQWVETTVLPHPRSYISNTTLALNDVLYVVGGFDGQANANKNSILWTRPDPAGKLEEWRESKAFADEGISCSVAVATPGYIHLLGGFTQSDQVSARVWSAAINVNGSVAGWERGPDLPMPLWFHNAGVIGGRVWVWGGLATPQNISTNPRIFSAPVLASGKIGDWQEEKVRLPHPFYRCTCEACGNYLLSFCVSYQGGILSSDIHFAQVSGGTLSSWQRLPTNIPSKLYISTAVDFRRGLVYIPGGRISKEAPRLDNNVYVMRLAARETKKVGEVAQTTVDQEGAGARHLSYMRSTRAREELPSGFLDYEDARRYSLGRQLPLLVCFSSPNADLCKQQRQYLSDPRVAQLKNSLVLGWVPTTVYPQLLHQLGVFRVPCWIYYDGTGRERARHTGALDSAELLQFVQTASQVR